MSRTQLIADCCRNHLGNSELVKEMIHKAATNGADYVKFQLYSPQRLDRSWPNYTDKFMELSKHQLTDSQISVILEECKKLNIIPMFTMFALDRLDFLKCSFDGRQIALKVASPDMSNHILIKGILKHFRCCQLFISTGMHEISEIKKTLRAFGNSIHWFYCVSHYPTLPEEINWDLLQMFDGFSDHTIGVNCAKKAVDFETKYIEKHFTLSRNLPGTDQQLSIEPHELLLLSEYIKNKEKEKMYKKRWSNECISSNL